MEIPGNNEIRIKNRIIEEKAKVGGKAAKSDDSGVESSSKTGGSSSEQIVLSSRAKDIQKAHEAIRAAPDIRVDKINRIKKDIADGRYRVESKDLAEKVLKDIITS